MKINCWRTRAGSPSSLASRCASTAQTGRICVPKRPWPRMWGRDPTSSSARTSNRSCIRTSWWMSASWRTTLGRSTAAGSRSVRRYCTHEGRWIAIPIAVNGAAMVYRKSMLRAAGFEQFPKDLPGFLKLCQALKAKGTPSGFPLGHATGDANGWASWLLWAFGGRLTNEKSELALNSIETIAALEYAKELYQTFVPGTLSWLDPNNNKAFLAGEISLTMNAISIYYTAKTSPDSNLKAMVPDIQHAIFPIGPIGKQVHGALMFPGAIYEYCKYPNAAKDYLRFIMEREQYEPWQRASIGYISHTLRATTPTRCGPMTRSTCSFATSRAVPGTLATRAGWARNRRRYSQTSSSSTCSARSAPDSRPRRRQRSAPRNARGGTIGARGHI